MAHVSVDVLSAYIDRELSSGEISGVEEHLEKCAECRRQLDSLGRVVSRLRGLERLAPPQLLEMDVQRRVALTAPRRSFLDDFDARLGRLPIQPGTLVTFALIFAFAAILYTFAEGLEDRRQETIPVILGPSATVGSEDAVVVDAVGQAAMTWVWEGEWTELPTTDPIDGTILLGSAEWLALRLEQAHMANLEELLVATQRVRLDDGRVFEVVVAAD